MFFKKENYTTDFEILASDKNLVRFSATVKQGNTTADSNGKKWIPAGTLITSEGAIVTQTGSSGSETYSAVPVGVIYQAVDVTNGDAPCSLIVEGYLKEDIVLADFATAAKTKIKEALPNIKFI